MPTVIASSYVINRASANAGIHFNPIGKYMGSSGQLHVTAIQTLSVVTSKFVSINVWYKFTVRKRLSSRMTTYITGVVIFCLCDAGSLRCQIRLGGILYAMIMCAYIFLFVTVFARTANIVVFLIGTIFIIPYVPQRLSIFKE